MVEDFNPRTFLGESNRLASPLNRWADFSLFYFGPDDDHGDFPAPKFEPHPAFLLSRGI
jgi:hypothetical protein